MINFPNAVYLQPSLSYAFAKELSVSFMVVAFIEPLVFAAVRSYSEE